MASRVLPFSTHFVARNAREMLARDRERAQKIMAGIHPHGPRAVEEFRSRHRHRHHHHHHKAGHGETDDPSTGTGSGTGTTPGGGSGAPSPMDGSGVDVTDAGVTYTASVGVGSPATQFTLLIDTGNYSSVTTVFV